MTFLCGLTLLLSLHNVYCGNGTLEILNTGKGGLCDPTVNQASGRFKVDSGKEYFFWSFESRNDPANDPVFFVLSAGPGGASSTFTISHNGPCKVSADGTSVERNAYSWTTKANVVWLDHPVGVGFSTGSPLEKTEEEVVTNIYNFIKRYFDLTRYKGGLYLVGFSYAGHLIPQVAAIVRQSTIALEGLIFVNARIDALSQYPSYPEMAFKSTTTSSVITEDQYNKMVSSMPDCLDRIRACNIDGTVCKKAHSFCQEVVNAPVMDNGYNLYNLPQTCPHPQGQLPQGCDNQEYQPNVKEYMNSVTVKRFIGVTGDYVEINRKIFDALKHYSLVKVDQSIPSLLDSGVRIMVMAGDRDYVCNYLGLKQWMLGLEWSKKEAFKAAQDIPVKDSTGRVIALRRSIDHGLYTFVQVYGAGHGPALEKAAESLQLVDDFVSRRF